MYGVTTEIKWIKETSEIPILGGLFAFLLIFITPVLLSFASQIFFPKFDDEVVFSNSMLLLMPGWNLYLWFLKIKTKVLLIPAWILFGLIAILRVVSDFYIWNLKI